MAKKRSKRKRARPLRDPRHRPKRIDVKLPADATVAERADAQHFVDTLEANRQIAHGPGPLPSGTTHRIESAPKGKKRLVRKRFSAL